MHKITELPINKPVTWILVADGKQAQIYVRKNMGRKVITNTNSNYVYNKKTTNSEVMPLGTAFIAEQPEITSELTISFVKTIAAYLNTARAKRQFNRLVLIAPSKLLGELRSHLNKTVELSIIAELSKDLTHCDHKSLAAHLEDIA
jgi:protein required for attachment to host cells